MLFFHCIRGESEVDALILGSDSTCYLESFEPPIALSKNYSFWRYLIFIVILVNNHFQDYVFQNFSKINIFKHFFF